MNHKRGRAKNRRSGCLMCKSHKVNGAKMGRHDHRLNMRNVRRQAAAEQEMRIGVVE